MGRLPLFWQIALPALVALVAMLLAIEAGLPPLVVSIPAVALVLAASWWIARSVGGALDQVRAIVRQPDSVPSRSIGGPPEIEGLSSAVRERIDELDRRVALLAAERSEQSAVLAGMLEGVLAIDRRERVMSLNPAAARLFEVDAVQARGRTIHEVARNAELQRFVAEALGADGAIERDVVLHGEETQFLQAHGSPVRDDDGARIGAVIVLNDVTRLRKLETMRRDFVANVSHELKTPVTSIKGFLETLLRGAIDDPANARRFVEIASRQADRLGAIIEDMLVLSRVDRESEEPGPERLATALETVVSEAVEVCRLKADQRGVRLDVRCDPGIRARINAALVEQALVNLIDNAIKFSEGDDVVSVTTGQRDGIVEIRVRDSGAGIDAEHLPRLFERFYRVDKARSRSIGGTGLGLAIVKHIAESQGGSIDVESKPGSGSTFTLSFPAA